MKVMFRRCLIMALAIIMAFGLAIPAFAGMILSGGNT